ncbi:hypothetical protein PHBOTO_001121 [Pseudozyma hubeiensis]|nr:hypothetical protein PHBOTO_001121 [Pseudozyma hubeiensis]
MALDQASARLLLQGLPSRTQISLDAHPEIYLINEQFAGIKSLPPGWHCISWNIASSESSTNDASQATPSVTSIRNVLLRWFDEDETAVREKEDGKLIWGKSRPPTETFEVAVNDEDACAVNDLANTTSRKRSLSTESTADADDDESLLFTNFDLKRSWPAHSIGAGITRWSEDKSWLLQDVARRSHLGIAHPVDGETSWYLALLCEFELAFVLFITANNAYAFDHWKDLIVLFCRSSSLIGAQSAFQLHPSAAMPASDSHHNTAIDLTAHTAFLTTLHTHLLILPTDFWSSQSTTQQESHLLKQLDVLRANIARSLSTPSQRQHKVEEAHREQLVKAWRVLSHTTASKFGWTLDFRLDEEAEVQDDIEAEEGEDAPVIVDL